MKTAETPDGTKTAPFFIAPAEKSERAETARRLFPEAVKRSIRNAEFILEHVFDLLGSGPVRLGEKIDWHRDFKSGISWDAGRRYGMLGECVNYSDSSDVKVPWDLNSFLHLPTLGKAWWFTGDERFPREFAAEIADWMANNPYPLGINWACAMKVAHRTINWIWGYYFFREAEAIRPEFWPRFLDALRVHGKFIMSRREDERPASNHYLLCLAGLFFLGVSLPGLPAAGRWKRFAFREFNREILIHVYPDGVHYEGSIYYHYFAAEIFLSASILGERAGTPFPPSFLRRLEKMLEFVLSYSRTGGSVARIGDQDDGRVQILSDYSNWNRLDHRRLLSSGAALFGRPDFKAAAGGFHEETFWLLGKNGRERFQAVEDRPAFPVSRSFPFGGYYVMRDGELHLIVDCIPRDRRAPVGHIHNSRLSFELSVGEVDFIVDPGTFTYTADPDRRNLFRSTGFHNTVAIGGREQNFLRRDRPWSFQPGGRLKVRAWKSKKDYDFLDAEYVYSREKPLDCRILHRRLFYFSKTRRFWVIRDYLTGRGQHSFRSRLCFDAGVELVPERRAIAAEKNGKNLYAVLIRDDGEDWGTEETFVSKSYGKEERSRAVFHEGTFSGAVSFGMVLMTDYDEAAFGEAESVYRRLETNFPES